MSFSALKKLIKKQSMHRFYTDVDAQALTPKFAAQFVATLGLTGAMALGTTSLVAAAINDDTISNNLDRTQFSMVYPYRYLDSRSPQCKVFDMMCSNSLFRMLQAKLSPIIQNNPSPCLDSVL